MQTTWNLKKFFYASIDDPQIERDVEKMKKAYDAFAKKYATRTDYLKDPGKLVLALQDYERFTRAVGHAKPLLFLHYTKELDNSNTQAEGKLNKLSQELTAYENKVMFFGLRLGKIEKKLQAKMLKDKRLAPYRYMLQKAFESAKYDLTEAEEKILNLKSLTSRSMWVDGVDRVVNKLMVPFKGKSLPINEALGIVSSLPRKDRLVLHSAIMQKLHDASEFAESEMNAIVTDKKISDDLRGFKSPWSATILGYQNDEKAILALVDAVTDAFDISHRFYKVKAKLMGVKTLSYADRSAPIGKNKTKIPFVEAVERYRAVLAGIDSEYVDILNRFLKDGQIDVYPKAGKSGGAYCSSNIDSPTMVLLNQTDDFKSFMTLAHEMGHAIHAEMSKKQPLFYQGHTISVAETASTLFEQLTFEEVFKTLPKHEQMIALHDRINDDISTIFRQIAFFNFEKELHLTIRAKGKMSKEEIAALLNKHMASYMGPVTKMNPEDGNFFIVVSHFRRFFYVYAYTYGQLISRAMCEAYQKDHSFAKKIKQFLTDGESKSPDQIFKDIGLDTTKVAFFKQGLESIRKDITRLEKLTA